MARVKTKQLRVIPVESAVTALHNVAPYNKIREMVRRQELISVAECICRKEQHLLGKECDRPKETCLGFGQFARFYAEKPQMEPPPKDFPATLKKIETERLAGRH